jgi:hypothetical protein
MDFRSFLVQSKRMENKFLSHLGVFAPLVRVQVFKTCGGCEQRSLSVRFRYTPVVSRYAESPGKRRAFCVLTSISDLRQKETVRDTKSHSETSREQAADKSEASQSLDLRPHYPIAIMDHG